MMASSIFRCLRSDHGNKPKLTSKAKNPWENFFLLETNSKSRELDWNPWPVKYFQSSPLFQAAQEIIKQRNEQDVDSFINKVCLLPASNSVKGVHGKTWKTELYSIRSPSRPPTRIHLWVTLSGKIMVIKGTKCLPLVEFLETFEVKVSRGPCKHYEFWKSVQISDELLTQMETPNHLYEPLCQRWWAVNGFQFLQLPFELRNMILSLAIGNIIEPYASVYRPAGRLPLPKTCTNLVLVNKQIRGEAMPIMLSQLTYRFRKHGQLLRFFKQISTPSLYALKSLELNFDHETLLDFFGAQVFRRAPIPGYSTSDYYFKDSHFTTRLRLEHLRICFPHPREHLKCRKLRSSCQRTVCLWIWAAARRCLRDIPNVEFAGCIKTDQKSEWLNTLALERKGILESQEAIMVWQMRVWSAE